MQRSVTMVVMTLVLVAGLSAGAATAPAGVAAQDDAAALPDGLALTQLAGTGLDAPAAGPAMVRLERLTVSEAPDGAELRTALGTELLYVVSGPVVIADDFGLEGRLESGAELPLQAPTGYSLRADEGGQATLLRFSLLDSATAAGAASASNVKSEVLIERELAELPAAPVELRLLRAAWDPGVDAGRRVFAGPLGLVVEQGILSVTGPSGLEGQLAAGETFVIPAGVPARLRNAEADPTTLLMAAVLPTGSPPFGADPAVEESPGPSIVPDGSEDGDETTTNGCSTETFYRATAKNGRFEDWDLGGPWKTVKGVLLFDGSAGGEILAPIPEIGCDDYAVQARVQWISGNARNHYGLLARRAETAAITAGDNYYGELIIWVGPWGDWSRIAEANLAGLNDDPNSANRWRTMRLEVDGNSTRFKVDQEAVSAIDNRYFDAGLAGIWAGQPQIAVRCFEIIGIETKGSCTG